MDAGAAVSVAAAVASAAAAVAAVWLAARTFRQSAELQAFLSLTARYEEIVDQLPPVARTSWSWPADADPDLAIRLRYLNLCSEEYYLRRRRLLSDRVWSIWEREMLSALASEPYVAAWPQLRNQFESSPEFVEFVDTAQRRSGGTSQDRSQTPR